MLKTINTNLKFAKHSVSGKVVSFISKKDGVWKGVRETFEGPKIIVLLDIELAKKVEEQVIYKCKLIPMSNKLGYIAVSASPLQYTAKVSIEYLPKTFKVNVRFGNQTVVYDPNSKKEKFNSFECVSHYLESLPNIANIGETIDNLRNNINIAKAQYV